jgi:hypothetical protein
MGMPILSSADGREESDFVVGSYRLFKGGKFVVDRDKH